MGSHNRSKLSLFLMELIVAILFFSLSAAVCVRLFTNAHLMAERTENLSNAVIWSQNLSESFTAKEGNLAKIADLYPDSYFSEDTLILFFNDNWEEVDKSLSQASYEVVLKVRKDLASNVYADVTDYNTALEGEALVGNIAVMDIRGGNDVLMDIPADDSKILFKTDVDVYIGKGVS